MSPADVYNNVWTVKPQYHPVDNRADARGVVGQYSIFLCFPDALEYDLLCCLRRYAPESGRRNIFSFFNNVSFACFGVDGNVVLLKFLPVYAIILMICGKNSALDRLQHHADIYPAFSGYLVECKSEFGSDNCRHSNKKGGTYPPHPCVVN